MLIPARARIVRPRVRIELRVTAAHMAGAARGDCKGDPIGRALRPLIREDYAIVVGMSRVEFIPDANPRTGYCGALLPEPAQTFIRTWDRGYQVEPFGFGIEVPTFVLRPGATTS